MAHSNTAKDKFAALSTPTKYSLVDEIVTQLRAAIVKGQFEAGELLYETSLAQHMGVSRGPIREALNQLEREGLIVKEPNKSASVAQLSREDLDEVYSLRFALERLAVQEAVRKGQPEDFDRMQEIVDAMSRAVDRGMTEQEAAELDLNFHEALLEAGRHRRLCGSWLTLRPQIHVFLLSRNVANPDFREVAVNRHILLLNAIRERDEERAIAIIEEHIRSSYDRIVADYRPSKPENY